MTQLTRIDTADCVAIEPAGLDQARALADQIDIRSPLTIASFGQEIGRKTSEYADSLLAQARTGDLDEMGGKLNEVVLAAQQFDLDAFDNPLTRIPVVGRMIAGVLNTKARAFGQFTSLQGQVDKLMADVEKAQVRLAARATSLDSMYAGVDEEQRILATHARAAQLRLDDLDAELSESEAAGDPVEAERRSALEASRAALSKRVGDLAVLHHSALQTLPMIRMVQANNMVLVEKFQTIRNLTVPAWKRAFMMALALQEQKEAVALANTIDDATNYFTVRNSEILHENAVATARANQRLVVDVSTLRTVHQNVVKTLVDVRKANEEGVAMRGKAMEELGSLCAEMRTSLSGGVAVRALPGA